MRTNGLSQNDVYKKLNNILMLDETFSSGKIIGSMCTKPHIFSQKIYSKHLEKNIGDPGLLKGTSKLEKDIIAILGNLLSKSNAIGNVVSGGTEANILAMWSARNYFNKLNPEIIIPTHSHNSFYKAADLLGIKLVQVPDVHGIVDITKVKKSITKNTIMLVGVAGTTPLGLIDPIDNLSDLASDHSLLLHVDASFGGFVIPFLKDLGYSPPVFDFKLPGVSSIAIDSHKMGLAPIPSSCILFRKRSLLKGIKNDINYLSGGHKSRSTLLGTSPGASIISLWSILNLNGRNGYVKLINQCMKNTDYFYNELIKIPNISVVSKPVLNIIGFKITSSSQTKFIKSIRQHGWAISVFPTHIRIVIMPHIKRKHIDSFIKDIKNLVKNSI
tara:strand:- start:4443 stop:5600 length:1158 start_codon:yes stop_codon:yes gene_type:complete